MPEKPEIIIAETSGFCPGVKGVLRKIDAAISDSKTRVFTFGKAIHNPGVVRDYEAKGVGIINSASDAPDGSTVIIRAHGLPRTDMEELAARDLHIIDGTCPKVKKVHTAITEAVSSGCHIIVAGYEDHAETAAHVSLFPEHTTLISSAAELENITFPDSALLLIAQTTFDPAEFNRIAAFLEAKYKGSFTEKNTICPCTTRAQEEASEIASRVDAMIVIGGRGSANTLRLVERCREKCETVIHVENAGELDAGVLSCALKIGVTAGASTPLSDIENVVLSLRRVEGY